MSDRTNLVTVLSRHTEGKRVKMAKFDQLGPAKAIFQNHAAELGKLLRKWPAFVGCVAWLTDMNILRAMKGKCWGMTVQKEDFLRPDGDDAGNAEWAQDLQAAYEELSPYGMMRAGNDFSQHHTCSILSDAFGLTCNEVPVIACVGLARQEARANMHHKFLVFGEDTDDGFQPRAVWTGSFNMSRNASRSIENALYVEDTGLAEAYYEEWGAVMSIGEELDWDSEYVSPHHDFGET